MAAARWLRSSFWKARAGLALFGPVAALQAGCSSQGSPDPCPWEPPPAFSLAITAANGPLPTDTEVRLAYGGGYERYLLGRTDNAPSVLFCRTGATAPTGSAGAAGEAGVASQVSRLDCELWIEGSATVWVTGGQYNTLEYELMGEANECGPQTVHQDLVLGAEDVEPKPL